jgi:light-regulated signal transduction histidine kinase (bacteriophytochrome)
LRAPLRHVSGFVDLLQRKGSSLDPDTMRLVDFIGTAAKQMNHLVDDLLRLSRMTRAEIRLTEVDLSSLVGEVRAGFDGELDGRAVEWRVDPLPHVKADPALLRVVLTNLIGNAIKYTRPRNPAVIEIGSEPDGGQQVIYVRDNGVGFDMEYTTKLFGVFQRFHHAEEFEGTGIGLATVQRIITRLGGRVWAQAKENEGATFYFSLPASPPPHQSPNHP